MSSDVYSWMMLWVSAGRSPVSGSVEIVLKDDFCVELGGFV